MFKITVVHLVAISTAVSVGLLWFYWRLNKVERQVCTLNNQLKALEQAKSCAPEPWNMMRMEDVLGQCMPPQEVEQEQEQEQEVQNVQPVTDTQSVNSEDVREILNNLSQDEAVVAPAPTTDDAKSTNATETDYELTIGVKSQDNTNYESWILTEDELNKKTVGELKQYLQSKELSTKGNKRDLIQRIISPQ
jgi:SAP domain